MREIKFRAWDGKFMINPYCELRENRFWGEDLVNTGFSTPIAVMQFTGLRDKHNKPIFEGDIVKYADQRIGEVKFVQFRASFSVGGRFTNNDLYKYVGNGNTVEVIGNIYENAELLNV